jgi:hypothetical protein
MDLAAEISQSHEHEDPDDSTSDDDAAEAVKWAVM